VHAAISRTQFLRGDFRGDRHPVRPPWALPEGQFIEICTRCADCVSACPDGLIKNGRGDYPEIDFTQGGCDFCGDCVTACKPKALVQSSSTAPPWSIVASIEKNCLSLNAVTCRSCGDVCDEEAISFKLQTGGRAIPHLEPELCSGCGECIAVCPVKAVRILPKETRGEITQGGH